MSKIILFISNPENCRLLADTLSERHEVILPENDEALAGDFDLGILDGEALDRLWEKVKTRQQAVAPAFLPFLFVTPAQDVSRVTRHLGQGIDELLTTPIEQVELQARLENLLERRRLSLDFHRALYESSLDAILLTAPDGRILAANPAACRLFERGEAEIFQAGRDGLVDLSDPRLPAALEERARAGKFTGELNFLRKNGERFSCEVSSALFADQDGKTRASMIIRDISERKQTEQELNKSRERLGQVLDTVKDSLVVFDSEITEKKKTEQTLRESERYHRALFIESPIGLALCRIDGVLVDVNPAYARILGRAVEETLPLTSWDITPEEYAAQEQAQLESLEKTGRYGPYEKEYIHKDGHRVPVRLQGLFIEKDNERYIWSSVEDITERKRAEQLLAAELNVLEMISANAPLTDVLTSIVEQVEAFSVDTIGSILLLDPDGIHVHHGAAPHLPAAYNQALEGAPIGPQGGSCGTAMYLRKQVIVTDIETDPLWVNYRGLAKKHGLRACWSTPVINAEGKVLASFAMYYREPRSPEAQDFLLIERMTHLAQLAFERKQAEGKLKESEEKFRGAFESANVGKSITLPTGEVSVNKAFADMLGYSREDLAGKTWQELTPKEEVESIEAKLAPLLNGEKDAARFNKRYLRKDGSPIWGDVSVMIRRDPDGKPVHFITTIIDITERKRAEDALQSVTERYRRLFEDAPVMYATTRNEGGIPIITDCNKALRRALGFSPDEIIGMVLTDLYTPESRRVSLESNGYQRALAGRFGSEERELVSRDGKIIKTLAEAVPEVEPDGSAIGTWVMFMDITERKQAEETLRESETTLRKAQQVAHIGNWSWHTPTNRLEWSDEMYHIFGIERESFSGDLPEVIARAIHPDDRKSVEQVNISIIQGGEPRPLEYRVVWPDGTLRTVWAEAGEMIVDETGKPVKLTGIVQDITERKRVEGTLAESEERLRLSTELANVAVWEYSFVTNSMSRSRNHDSLYGLEWQEKWDINTFLNATHPDDRACSNETIQKSVAPGGPDRYTFDFRVVYPDGPIRWLNVVGQVVERDAQGQGKIVRGTLIDITARKQAEEARRQSEEMFLTIFHETPVSTLLATIPDGRIHDVNNAYLRLTGFKSREDVLGKSIEELGLAYDVKTQERIMQEFRASGRVNNAEMTFRDSNGLERTVLVGMIPVNAGGRSFLLSTSLDITERKQAEAKLENQARLLELSYDAILAWELGGGIEFWNRGAEELYGYTAGEAVGKVSHELLQTIHPHGFDDLQTNLEKHGGWSGELTHTNRAGRQVIVETRHQVVDFPDGRRLVLETNRDITERKRAEGEIHRRANELSALNTLAQNIGRTLSLEQSIRAALKEITATIQPDAAFLFLRESEQLKLVGIAPQGAQEQFGEMPEHRVGACMCGLAVTEAKPLYSRDIYQDMRCTWEECKKAGLRSFAALPMFRSGEVFGVVGLASAAERDFGGQAKFLETFASQMSTGIRNALLHKQAREHATELEQRLAEIKRAEEALLASREQLRQISARLAEAQEAERLALARELHDQVGQGLTALGVNLNLIRSKIGRETPKALAARFDSPLELVSEVTEKIRNVMAELHPPVLEDFGLAAALRWHAERLKSRTELEVDVQGKLILPRLSLVVGMSLFRIAQEALTNVVKHAGTNRASIWLSEQGGEIRLEIVDDGQGFQEQRLNRGQPHWGLAAMRERAEALGGRLEIESAPGHGTKIIARLPRKP